MEGQRLVLFVGREEEYEREFGLCTGGINYHIKCWLVYMGL